MNTREQRPGRTPHPGNGRLAPLLVFVVEDHPVVREAVVAFLRSTPGLEPCGVAATGAEALERLTAAQADLVLVDVALHGVSGIDLVRTLQGRQPGLRCLMLSGHSEATYVRQALAAGACGYVLKGDPSELAEAIGVVAAGGTYLSEAMKGDLQGRGG